MLRLDKTIGGRDVPVGMWGTFANHGTVNGFQFTYYNEDHHGAATLAHPGQDPQAGPRPALPSRVVTVYGNTDEGDQSAGLHQRGPAYAEHVGTRRVARLHARLAAGGQAHVELARSPPLLDDDVLLRAEDLPGSRRRQRPLRPAAADRIGGGPRAALRHHPRLLRGPDTARPRRRAGPQDRHARGRGGEGDPAVRGPDRRSHDRDGPRRDDRGDGRAACAPSVLRATKKQGVQAASSSRASRTSTSTTSRPPRSTTPSTTRAAQPSTAASHRWRCRTGSTRSRRASSTAPPLLPPTTTT